MRDFSLLFRKSVRDIFRLKNFLGGLLLSLMPALFAILQRMESAPEDFNPETVYNVLTAGVVFGFLLVILAVFFATGVLSQEIEQQTISYLLTHPVPRWKILLAKYLASVVSVVVPVWASLLLLSIVTFKGGEIPFSRVRTDLFVLFLGALAYNSLFLFVATLLRRPLLYGLAFAFLWETWVPTMPGKFQKLSLMAYLRVLAPHPQPQTEALELSELFRAFNPEQISKTEAYQMLLGVFLFCLAGAIFAFSLREYVPKGEVE